MRYFCNSDIVKLARQEIEGKTQAQWAKENGISPAYLSEFLSGYVTAGPLILKALGFNQRPFYRRVAQEMARATVRARRK